MVRIMAICLTLLLLAYTYTNRAAKVHKNEYAR